MDKDQLLRFISLIVERSVSHTLALDQLSDILKEQNAPQELIDLVKFSCDGFLDVRRAIERNSELTEKDIRDAEAEYRRRQEQNIGRC
ncbi:MAG: hypothetical protein J5649_03920 [Lachnospiraceae bacterium]|nr:hypothetical protein [Lachnospiraceae bacterium]